jgi:hypothetical protein
MHHRPQVKWKFAIGTTSFVPGARYLNAGALHYLIVDVDDLNIEPTLKHLCSVLGCQNLKVSVTPRGWHIYTDRIYRWNDLIRVLRTVPNVDQRWIAIGTRRGYLYLADKQAIRLRWPVVRMVIHYHVKERWKRNT